MEHPGIVTPAGSKDFFINPKTKSMKMFKEEYRDLEMRVLANLRYKVQTSKEYSKHVAVKCIKVNIFDYTELVFMNNDLIFMDNDGLQYSYSTCSLEDLIDILNS